MATCLNDRITVDGRRVRGLWWEGNDLYIQFDDDGSEVRFTDAYFTMGESAPVDNEIVKEVPFTFKVEGSDG